MVPKFRVFAFVLAATISSAWAQPKTKMIIGTGVDPSLAQFYVAKEAGIFERNGLDVQLNQGPSGSSMIAFLIGDQIQAALGAELAFMRSMVEATEYLKTHRHEAAGQIAHLLKLDPGLTETLMAKGDYGMRLDNDSLAHMREIEAQLKQGGKLTKPVDWSNFFLTDPLRAAAPAAVTLDPPK
jgi:ABC-type nitrate/sulfonate/bicarbonate transport system substrate-binding protein